VVQALLSLFLLRREMDRRLGALASPAAVPTAA
jgi:hypothetical protein